MFGVGHNFRKFLSFDKKEARQLLITAIVAGFSLSFGKWGEGDTVNVALGLGNMLLGTIFFIVGMLFHIGFQKIWAIQSGYVVRYMYWKLGLVFSIILTFIITGVFPFLPVFFTGCLEIKTIPTIRVGKYRPRIKFWEYALVSFAGPLGNLLLIWILKPFFLVTGAEILKYFIVTNLFIIIYSMVPVPFFHGIKVVESGRTSYDIQRGTIGFNCFFANRELYAFFLVLLVAYAILIMAAGIFSIILAFLITIVLFAVFFASSKAG